MKIGIIGVGFIGASLARAWAKLWHQLTIP